MLVGTGGGERNFETAKLQGYIHVDAVIRPAYAAEIILDPLRYSTDSSRLLIYFD